MGQSLWVRDAAEYEPEGDHIICRWEDNEWIMSPAIARITLSRLGKALEEWRVGNAGEVVQLSKH